jgi:hypothetical protein
VLDYFTYEGGLDLMSLPKGVVASFIGGPGEAVW